MNAELYVPAYQTGFKVKRTEVSYKDASVLFFTRLVWSFIPVSGKWYQTSLLYSFQILSVFLTIPIDLLLMTFEKLIIPIILILAKGFIDMIFKLFGKFFGWLILIGLVFSVFSIIYSGEWRNLYQMFLDLYSSFF